MERSRSRPAPGAKEATVPENARGRRGRSSPAARRKSPAALRNSPAATGVALKFRTLKMDEVSGYVDVISGSYPLFFTDRDRTLPRFQEVLTSGYPELIGAFAPDGRIVGTYAFYRYVSTILGRGIPMAGLGLVATALDHKKEKVALRIVRDFVRRSRSGRLPLSLLYPFRHDFYADMGWGAVGEANQYVITPAALPLYPERTSVRWVRETDWKALDRIHRQSLGLQDGLGISRHPIRWVGVVRQSPQIFLAGPAHAPEGYMLARFVKHEGDADMLRQDLDVIEMDWTTPEAMRALIGFLASQRDQVTDIILDWPREGNLEAILRYPARRAPAYLRGHHGQGPTIGYGAMLRLENPQEAFHLRPYRGPDAVALEVSTSDPLEKGRPIGFRAILRGEEAPPATRPTRARLSVDLANLARLWAGALGFREGVDFGLLRIDPPRAAEPLERLFAVPKPWIVERF